MIAALYRRTLRSVTTFPTARGWVESLWFSILGICAVALMAAFAGLLVWQPDTDGLWPRVVMVLIVPALSEELFFRGLLIPDRNEVGRPVLWICTGLIIFVLWHVVEALTFLPKATLFLTPAFLICAAIIGLTCAIMRYRTGSIWPAVIFHGVMVWLWQSFFGGLELKDMT